MGAALSVKAIAEALLINKRDTKEKWQVVADATRVILEANKGSNDPRLQAMAQGFQEFPFLERMWVRTGESWRQMTSEAFSPEAIDAWMANSAQR